MRSIRGEDQITEEIFEDGGGGVLLGD